MVVWFILTSCRHTIVLNSVTVKGIMLCYPTAWRGFSLKDTVSIVIWKRWISNYPTIENTPLNSVRSIFRRCLDPSTGLNLLSLVEICIATVSVLPLYIKHCCQCIICIAFHKTQFDDSRSWNSNIISQQLIRPSCIVSRPVHTAIAE